MADTTQTVKLDPRLIREITVVVKTPKLVSWRMRVGLWLVGLGVRVSGMGLETEEHD